MASRRAILLLPIGVLWFWGGSAIAQRRSKPWRIGFIYVGSKQSAVETGRWPAFLQGMRELGYVEGRDFLVEARYAEATEAGYRRHAAELVKANVDLIVSTATPIHRELQRLTRTIPIVMTVSPDPVGEGLAASLARPGGNITGITSSNAELSLKYYELLSASVPNIRRIGVLLTTTNGTHRQQLKNVQAAIQPKGIPIVPRDVRKAEELDAAVADLAGEKVDAVIILADGIFVQHARRLATAALQHRLPTIYGTSEYPVAGGMMSYGPEIKENYRRAAVYVDKIVKGAKPAELPIEQPTRFDLTINMGTVKALGLKIPSSVLLRAGRLID
jgi:putative tryptophan/tyrosine transport system substrate-binding protein